MQQLLQSLQAAYPDLSFVAGQKFYWSPATRQVFYAIDNSDQAQWSLLHETAHALLGHTSYRSDIELLKMEMSAWQSAQELATAYAITIDDDHIQDCLDTYRDWLHARAICPSCTTRCLQRDDSHSYRCHNCHTDWKVTPSRFCRPYRSINGTRPTTVFAANAL